MGDRLQYAPLDIDLVEIFRNWMNPKLWRFKRWVNVVCMCITDGLDWSWPFTGRVDFCCVHRAWTDDGWETLLQIRRLGDSHWWCALLRVHHPYQCRRIASVSQGTGTPPHRSTRNFTRLFGWKTLLNHMWPFPPSSFSKMQYTHIHRLPYHANKPILLCTSG